jgi:hypothetical protein
VGGGLVSQGITTDAGVSAFGDISAGGNLSVKGSLLIRGDTPMSAAPRMYLTGYVPGPMAALDVATPIFTIQSKNILITRITSWGVNPCPAAGTLTFSIVSRNPTTWIDLYDLILKADGSATDSGPLSIAVVAGDQFYGQVSAPNCGTFGGKVANIPVSVEYVMQ